MEIVTRREIRSMSPEQQERVAKAIKTMFKGGPNSVFTKLAGVDTAF
jgi:hypothetical protein